MKKKGSIVRKQTAPPAGPASAVAGFVGEVMSTVMAPIDAANLAIARATLALLDILPKMPAARLYSDLVFQFGHSHPHPPTFGFPVPSTGPLLAAGCMSVLINGQPAARNGDMGLAVWCGGYFPIFELITGSSHVFIGGARAARTTMDITLHCLPDPLGGKWGIGKIGIAMAAFGAGMSVVGALAASEQENAAQKAAAKAKSDSSMAAKYADQMAADGSISKQEVADAQADAAIAAAEAESAAAEGIAAGVGAATAAAQAAADIAAIAMGMLMGKDPGVGFPLGMVITGSPNVLIGGFPMPGWDLILKGLFKVLRPVIRKIQMKLPQGKLRRAACVLTGHPVDVASGRLVTSKTDFEIEGRIPIIFERAYDTASTDYEGPFGWGWTHPYDQHLWESERFNCLIWRDREGRQVRLDKIPLGEKYFQPLERVWIERTGGSEYLLTDLNDGLLYIFGAPEGLPAADEQSSLQLVEIRDRNNNRIELKYSGRSLVEVANGSGVYVSLHYHEYRGKTRLAEIRQHLRNGRDINLIKYGYNEEAELISVVDRTYLPLMYAYSDHLLTKETNRNGLSFYFEYEGEGPNARCIHTWGDEGIYERQLTYAPRARITRVVDGLGGETVYHYNDLDLVTKIFDAEGGVYQYEYGSGGEVLQETDELGRTRVYSYDDQLNRTEVLKEDSTQIKVLFDKENRPLVIVDEAGGEWKQEYDSRSNIIASITPLNSRREYEYNGFGDVVTVRDSLGQETNYEWTDTGQISVIRRPLGGKTTFLHNERNFIAELVDDAGVRLQYAYDDVGRVNRIVEADSRNGTAVTEKFEYDSQNNLVLYVDRVGNKTSYHYSGFDKIAERVDARGNKRTFKYDAEERLIQLMNERGESYLYEYDQLDRIVAENGFDGAKTTYRYNLAGDLVYQTDILRREVFFRRDAMGRIVSRMRNDGSRIEFQYDECGRLIRANTGRDDVRFTYDSEWRPITESQNQTTIEYEYDSESRRTARRIIGSENISEPIEYTYDAEGNLASIRIGQRQIEYQRDHLGRLTRTSLPNGLQEVFDYDTNGRLLQHKIAVGSREIAKRGYEWNSVGNLVTMNDSLRGTRRYEYDAIDRLSRVERMTSKPDVILPGERQDPLRSLGNIPAEKRLWQADVDEQTKAGQIREVEEFSYDVNGNLIERTSNVHGSRKFKYGAGDKLEQQEKTRYIYDAVGNLIEKSQPGGGYVRYEYNVDNQLISVSTATGGKIEFTYDAFGRRSSKIAETGTTSFLWDGDVLLGEQKDTFCQYVHDGFVPLARIENSKIYHYHTDHFGVPKELSSPEAELVWTGSYDEFGKLTYSEGVAHQPIRFQNQYEDSETGLLYNRFRYYDADSGRYTSRDPIALLGGANLYRYGVNPINWIDPYGLVQKPAAAKVPSKPGIYILTDPATKESYVGQGVDMKGRLAQSDHLKAQEMLDRPGVKVQVVEVDLGTAKTLAEKKRILSRFEQQQFELQKQKGFTMLNDPSCPPESAKKKQRNTDLVDEKGATKKRKKTC